MTYNFWVIGYYGSAFLLPVFWGTFYAYGYGVVRRTRPTFGDFLFKGSRVSDVNTFFYVSSFMRPSILMVKWNDSGSVLIPFLDRGNIPNVSKCVIRGAFSLADTVWLSPVEL